MLVNGSENGSLTPSSSKRELSRGRSPRMSIEEPSFREKSLPLPEVVRVRVFWRVGFGLNWAIGGVCPVWEAEEFKKYDIRPSSSVWDGV